MIFASMGQRGYGLVVEYDLAKVETGVRCGYWEPGFAGATPQDLLREFRVRLCE
jgi:hypothetical protein